MAIINGESQHGVTWHYVDEGIDTGAIVAQRISIWRLTKQPSR